MLTVWIRIWIQVEKQKYTLLLIYTTGNIKKLTDEIKDNFFQFSQNYMKEASKIIDDRSTVMVNHLKDDLDNYQE